MKWDAEYTRERATCIVCGQSFTPKEWEDRHSPKDGGEAHARCCPDCNGGVMNEREIRAAVRRYWLHSKPTDDWYWMPEAAADARAIRAWLDDEEELEDEPEFAGLVLVSDEEDGET